MKPDKDYIILATYRDKNYERIRYFKYCRGLKSLRFQLDLIRKNPYHKISFIVLKGGIIIEEGDISDIKMRIIEEDE